MGLFDQEPDTYPALPPSGSPGLATMPSTGSDAPMADMGGPTAEAPPMADMASATVAPPIATPPAGLSTTPPKTSGAGLADFKATRTDDDKEYIKNLPTAQKIGLALQAFGAGVNGRPDPVQALLDTKRKNEAEFRQELGSGLATIKTGIEMVNKVPPGPARDALIKQLAQSAGPAGGIVAATLSQMGTQNEDKVKDTIAIVGNPRVAANIIKAAANTSDPMKATEALLKDSDFMKNQYALADQSDLPGVLNKVGVFARAMSQMDQFKGADGKPTFTLSDLRAQNQTASPQFKLSDAELSTLSRNQIAASIYGLKTEKTQQDEQTAGVKTDSKGAQTEVGKLNAALASGEITKQQFDDEMKRRNLPLTNAGDGSAPGGAGTAILQDRDSGVKYAMTRAGQAFKMGDDGQWQSVNPNSVPASAQKIGSGTAAQFGREAVFNNRVITSAREAAADLKNVVELPLSASTGLFGGRTQGSGLLDATKEVLANKMSTQDTQDYNVMATGFQRSLATIEASGLAPSGSLTHQMDTVLLKEGDSQLTKLRKLAQTRQIVEAGLQVVLDNPRVTDKEKTGIQSIMDDMKAAVPFSQKDITSLQRMQQDNPEATLKDVMPKGDEAKPVAKAAAKPVTQKYVEGQVYKDAKGNQAKYVNGNWIPL